jgi:hypothetical protein
MKNLGGMVEENQTALADDAWASNALGLCERVMSEECEDPVEKAAEKATTTQAMLCLQAVPSRGLKFTSG